MANYYSILKKTISGMNHHSQGTRAAVYSKARVAIDRQLRAMEPTPPEEVIARQMQMLEQAIGQLDAEYSSIERAQTNIAQPANTAPAGDQQPDPISQYTPPTPAQQPPVQQPPVQQPPAQQPPTPPVQQTVQQPPTRQPPAANPPFSTQTDAAHLATQARHTGGDNKAADHIGTSPAPTPQVYSTDDSAIIDPQGMEYSETILANEPDTQAILNGDDNVGKSRGGFVSLLLPIILAIVVVGGGLYALWLNRDALLSGLSGDDKPPVVQTSADENVSKTKEDDAPKIATKLTPEGETVEIDPVPLANESSETSTTADEQDNIPSSSQTDDNVPQVVEIGEDGQPKSVEGENSDQSANASDDSGQNSTQETDATQQSNLAPAVAQKAFLYEEGTSGTSASRDNAAIIWSLSQETVDENTSDAVIKGQLDVPGRNLSMSMLIKRNRDESLPASHIIELVFQIPDDFSGGNISEVSRFVMKTSEQGRGEGLVAVPAKISDGNFLIALNNLEQVQATNIKLLLESSWIDLPLGYTTGRRALVTLEKGALGDKVFRDAFADWEKKQ